MGASGVDHDPHDRLALGLDFAATVGGGAILTESVFDLHGVGQYAAQSIGQLDVPPVLVIGPGRSSCS